jgi:hypothetical protein
MSVGTVRGGVPHVWRQTIDITGRTHRFPHTSLYFIIRVAAFPCRVYFTEADFIANANYVEVPVPSAGTPYGEWQGPVEAHEVWLRGIGGSSTVELVTFQRRG